MKTTTRSDGAGMELFPTTTNSFFAVVGILAFVWISLTGLYLHRQSHVRETRKAVITAPLREQVLRQVPDCFYTSFYRTS